MQSAIVFCAQYLIFVLIFLGCFAILLQPRSQWKRILIIVVISTIIGFIAAKLIGHFYYHPRPFVAYGIDPLVPHDASTGFPSEHTLLAFLIAFNALTFSVWWGWGLGVLALLVGLGRIAAWVHSPLDVEGGMVIAAVAVMLAYGAWRVWHRRKQHPTPR